MYVCCGVRQNNLKFGCVNYIHMYVWGCVYKRIGAMENVCENATKWSQVTNVEKAKRKC